MSGNGDAYDRELFEQLETDLRRGAVREAPGRDEHLGALRPIQPAESQGAC